MRSETLAPATTEPISLAQAKKQLEIAPDDTFHDVHVSELITAAREAVEHDTSLVLVPRELVEQLTAWEMNHLFRVPVLSVASVEYYDINNTLQTVSGSSYSLDAPRRTLRFNAAFSWPSVFDRWDAITITATAGMVDVPAVLKQAMLMWIGYHFENRDGLKNEIIYTQKAYENLVRQHLRSTYP